MPYDGIIYHILYIMKKRVIYSEMYEGYDKLSVVL